MAYTSRLSLIVDSSSGERSLKSFEKSLESVERRTESTAGSMQNFNRVAGLVIGALSVRQVASYADEWSELNSRVKLVSGSTQEAERTMSRLADTARSTYSSLSQTAVAFLDNASALTELGYSTEQQLDLSDSLNNALVVSATRGQRAQSVLLALSRAFAFGELRGDNFNTVVENGGRIVDALADGLGVTTLALRQMAADGALTTDRVIRALTSQMQLLREEADSMPATIEDGFTLMGNSALELVGTMDRAFGVSEGLAGLMVGAADAVRDNITPIVTSMEEADAAVRGTTAAVVGMTTAYVSLSAAVWASNAALTAFSRIARLNPVVLGVSAVAALGSAFYAAKDSVVEFGDTTADVSDWVMGAWQEVTARVEGYWGEAVDNVIAWLGDMGIDAESVATGIKDAFVTALDLVLGAHRTLFNTAVGIWYAQQAVVMGVADAITTAFTTMGSNARTVFDALWKDIQAMMNLDFSTSNFSNAIENELISVASAVRNSAVETAGRAAEQLTDDHLGRIVGNAKAYFDDLGTTIENRVATNQQIESLTALSRRLLSLGGTVEQTGEAVVVLGERGETTTDTVDRMSKAAQDAEREADRFASTLQSLTDRLFPVEAAQRTYREEQELLTLAWAKGEIGVMRYLDALNRLQQAQLSTQTASQAYGQGFGAEIGSRGDVGAPTDPLAGVVGQEQDYWGKWLESASNAFTDFDQMAANTAESFQRGFGNAFESMVFDSQSTGDALRGMAEGIARSTVNALGQMAGQWLAYQAVQMAVGKTSEAAAVASAAVTGTSIAAAYAPAAAAVSLASFGANSAPAMAGMSATYGLSSTLAMAGFADGGYTGPGGKYDPAGIVHAGEFVVRKEMVERPGVLAMLEGLNRGYANGGYVGSSPALGDRMDAYRSPASTGTTTTNSYQISVDARGSSNPAETRRQARLGAEEAIRQTQRDFERNGPLRRTLNV
ncbi:tape measure protein [Halomonas sp. KM072]